MKKSLEAVIGDYLVDIRTGVLFEVKGTSPFTLSSDNGTETFKDSQIRRWFKVAQMSNVTSNIQPQPVEPAAPAILTMDTITSIANQLGCTIKQNKDHIAIKYNNKNVMEVRPTKKYFNLIFRQSILDTDSLRVMQNQYNGKLVGNGTWTLNYRIQTTKPETFELVLRLGSLHAGR